MFSLNKVSLIGNVGNNPEIRKTKNGHEYVSLSIATTSGIKNKASGEWDNKTSWHKVKVYSPLCSVADRYLQKGSQVYIEGSLEYFEYTKDGITKNGVEIIAKQIIVLSGNKVDKVKAEAESYFNSPSPLPAPWQDDGVKFDPKMNPLRNMQPLELNDEIPF